MPRLFSLCKIKEFGKNQNCSFKQLFVNSISIRKMVQMRGFKFNNVQQSVLYQFTNFEPGKHKLNCMKNLNTANGEFCQTLKIHNFSSVNPN